MVPQAKTPKSKAGLLTRPFRSLPGGRLAKSAKVPEQLSGASGADFRKTQKPVVTRLFGLTAAGTVADSHGVPLAIAGAKIGIFPKKQEPPQKKRCAKFSDGEVTKERKSDFFSADFYRIPVFVTGKAISRQIFHSTAIFPILNILIISILRKHRLLLGTF